MKTTYTIEITDKEGCKSTWAYGSAAEENYREDLKCFEDLLRDGELVELVTDTETNYTEYEEDE